MKIIKFFKLGKLNNTIIESANLTRARELMENGAGNTEGKVAGNM